MDLEEGEIIISDISSDEELQPMYIGDKVTPSRAEMDKPTIKLRRRYKKKTSGASNYYCKEEVRESIKGKKCSHRYKRKFDEGGNIVMGSSEPNMEIVAEKMSRESLSASTPHNTNSKFKKSYKTPKKRKQKKRSSQTLQNTSSNDLNKNVYGKKKVYHVTPVHKTLLQSEPHFKHSVSGSLRSCSLMNKLITSGLAKQLPSSKSDLVKVRSPNSSPELDIFCDKNILPGEEVPSTIREEAITLNNKKMTQDEDEDSEIEVIIPPKKIPPLVTLDSDGEEVDATNVNESSSKQHISNQLQPLGALSTADEKCVTLDSQSEGPTNIVNNDDNFNSPTLSNIMIVTGFSDSSSIKCIGSEEEPEPYSPSSPSTCSDEDKEHFPHVLSNIDQVSSFLKQQEHFEDSHSSHSCNNIVSCIENQTSHKNTDSSIGQFSDGNIQDNISSSKESDSRIQVKEKDFIVCNNICNDQNTVQRSEVHKTKILSPKTQRIDELISDSCQESNTEKEPYSPTSFCSISLEKKETEYSCINNSDIYGEFSNMNNYLEKLPTIESQLACCQHLKVGCRADDKNTTNLKSDFDNLVLNLDSELGITNIEQVESPTTILVLNNQEKLDKNCTNIIGSDKSSFDKPTKSLLSTCNNTQCYDNNSKTEINANIIGSDDEDDLSQLRLIALSTKGKINQNLTLNKEQSNTMRLVNQSNTSAEDDYDDDEEEDILQLRVAALKSAVIKKHEDRKKRGLKVKKRNRESGEDFLPLSGVLETSFNQNSPSQSKASPSEIIIDLPLSNAEIIDSLQGEEDMEIASDSGGDIIQDGNIQEKSQSPNQSCELWESYSANTAITTCSPDSNVISDTVLTSYSVVPPQPLPPGVDSEFTAAYSNQPFSPVLPPPPPPPTTLMFSLAPPPPPPSSPPQITNIPSQQISISDQLTAKFDQSSFTALNYTEKLQHATVEDIVYHGKSFSSMNYETTGCVSNDDICSSDTVQIHNDLQSQPLFNTDFDKGGMLHLSHSQLRPNSKAIPVLVNIPKKILTKKKLKKMQKHKLKNKLKDLNQEPKLLCITNTPNFRKSRSKINLLLQPQNRNRVLCSTNLFTDGNLKQLTSRRQDSLIPKGLPVSLCDESTYSIPDSKNSSLVHEDEMDLSEMIVLDEVGMSPEYKSADDNTLNCSFKNDEEDENTLRARALTSLSSNAVSNRTAYSLTSKALSHNTFASKRVEIKDSSFRKEFRPNIITHIENKQRQLENISITRRVETNDSSKYRLTRVVSKEPRRSVVQGRESLKVVIPSDSPPIVSHPSPPVVDRLVINVGQDSDTDEDCEWMRRVRIEEDLLPPGPVVDHEMERSIDLLLLNARQTIENSECILVKKKEDPVTPKYKQNTKRDIDMSETPLRLLSKERQEEYHRLKKIIEEKEREIENQTRLYEQKKNISAKQKNRSVGAGLQLEMSQQKHLIPSQVLSNKLETYSQSVNKKSDADKRNNEPIEYNNLIHSKESIYCSHVIDFDGTVDTKTNVSHPIKDISYQTMTDTAKLSDLNRKKDTVVCSKMENKGSECITSKSLSQEMTLSSNKARLINERFMLIDDLSKMSESLSELEREQASVNKEVLSINELRKALLAAEERLLARTAVTQRLELHLLEAHQAVYKRHIEIQQLEAKCRELGTCLTESEYELPIFGHELMWSKIKQVSEKRDKVIAKRIIIRSMMENPDISSEEMTNNVALSSDVDQESVADKYSLLQFPNESVFTPLPLELIITGHKEIQSPCLLQLYKSQCEDSTLTNLPLEEPHSHRIASQVECSKSFHSPSERNLKVSNHKITSNSFSTNLEFQPPNLVSAKTTQEATYEVPEYSVSQSVTTATHLLSNETSSSAETIKIQESQVLELATSSKSTITHFSQSLKTLSKDIVGKHQALGTSASNKILTDNVSEKRKISEIDRSSNEPNQKRLNPCVVNRVIFDKNEISSNSYSNIDGNKNDTAECESANVKISKPVKSHLKYKSVLQYKKPMRSIPNSKAVGEIMCRYEIVGKCQDKLCKYKHFSPTHLHL